jgi:hypothetical protein
MRSTEFIGLKFKVKDKREGKIYDAKICEDEQDGEILVLLSRPSKPKYREWFSISGLESMEIYTFYDTPKEIQDKVMKLCAAQNL